MNQRQTGHESERQTDLSRDRLIELKTDVLGGRYLCTQTDTSKNIGGKVERGIGVSNRPRKKNLYSEEGTERKRKIEEEDRISWQDGAGGVDGEIRVIAVCPGESLAFITISSHVFYPSSFCKPCEFPSPLPFSSSVPCFHSFVPCSALFLSSHPLFFYQFLFFMFFIFLFHPLSPVFIPVFPVLPRSFPLITFSSVLSFSSCFFSSFFILCPPFSFQCSLFGFVPFLSSPFLLPIPFLMFFLFPYSSAPRFYSCMCSLFGFVPFLSSPPPPFSSILSACPFFPIPFLFTPVCYILIILSFLLIFSSSLFPYLIFILFFLKNFFFLFIIHNFSQAFLAKFFLDFSPLS